MALIVDKSGKEVPVESFLERLVVSPVQQRRVIDAVESRRKLIEKYIPSEDLWLTTAAGGLPPSDIMVDDFMSAATGFAYAENVVRGLRPTTTEMAAFDGMFNFLGFNLRGGLNEINENLYLAEKLIRVGLRKELESDDKAVIVKAEKRALVKDFKLFIKMYNRNRMLCIDEWWEPSEEMKSYLNDDPDILSTMWIPASLQRMGYAPRNIRKDWLDLLIERDIEQVEEVVAKNENLIEIADLTEEQREEKLNDWYLQAQHHIRRLLIGDSPEGYAKALALNEQ